MSRSAALTNIELLKAALNAFPSRQFMTGFHNVAQAIRRGFFPPFTIPSPLNGPRITLMATNSYDSYDSYSWRNAVAHFVQFVDSSSEKSV
jgi:hypothetical protein